MASKLFNYIFHRPPPKPVRIPDFPYKPENNPYRAKREWPPDFSTLSLRHQFTFEKRYKRRSALKYINPTWNKWTKIFQWSSISVVTVYGLFFMKMDYEPFNGRTMRATYKELIEKDHALGYENWMKEKYLTGRCDGSIGEAAEFRRMRAEGIIP